MTKFGKIIIVVLIIAIGVGLYFGIFSKKDQGVDEVIATETEDSFVYEEETDYFNINIRYPKDLVVTDDAELFIYSKIGEFKKMFEDFSEEDWGVLKSSAAGKYSLGSDYIKKDSGFGIVTYILNTHEYTGGAHGNPGLVTFTYDSDGNRLEIKDFIKEDTQNLSAIASLVLDGLATTVEGGIDSLFLEGLSPDLENYSNFYLESDDLVFLFPPYQAGPYVLGTLEARISLEEVFGYMEKKYIPALYEDFEKEYKGELVFGGEVRTLTDCDGGKVYWYHDTTGNLNEEYNKSQLYEETYEKVPAILRGYVREVSDSDSELSKEYDGILVVSELSQVGGEATCD